MGAAPAYLRGHGHPGMPMHDRSIPCPGIRGRLACRRVSSRDRSAENHPAELTVDGVGSYTDASFTTFVTTDGEVLIAHPAVPAMGQRCHALIFTGFIIPGLVYGIMMKNVTSSKDAAKVMIESIAAMAPIIVLAFFAAQFIEYLKFSQSRPDDRVPGGMIRRQRDEQGGLIIAFILVTMLFNLFIGSMSAKYAMFARSSSRCSCLSASVPSFTEAAYRIGDSTTNIITPLNAYLVIILVFMREYAPRAGWARWR